jgi:hypothetical protein
MEKKSNAYRLFVEKPEERIPLGRPGRRWVDNSKTDLERCDGVVWI